MYQPHDNHKYCSSGSSVQPNAVSYTSLYPTEASETYHAYHQQHHSLAASTYSVESRETTSAFYQSATYNSTHYGYYNEHAVHYNVGGGGGGGGETSDYSRPIYCNTAPTTQYGQDSYRTECHSPVQQHQQQHQQYQTYSWPYTPVSSSASSMNDSGVSTSSMRLEMPSPSIISEMIADLHSSLLGGASDVDELCAALIQDEARPKTSRSIACDQVSKWSNKIATTTITTAATTTTTAAGADESGDIDQDEDEEGDEDDVKVASRSHHKNGGKQGAQERPPKPYLELIAEAILSFQTRMMQLHEIYAFLETNYSYFANDVNKMWRNSVRHNLSRSVCFIKVGRGSNGKGNFWRIHPLCENEFAAGRFQLRKFNKLIRQGSSAPSSSSSSSSFSYASSPPSSSYSHIAFDGDYAYQQDVTSQQTNKLTKMPTATRRSQRFHPY